MTFKYQYQVAVMLMVREENSHLLDHNYIIEVFLHITITTFTVVTDLVIINKSQALKAASK